MTTETFRFRSPQEMKLAKETNKKTIVSFALNAQNFKALV